MNEIVFVTHNKGKIESANKQLEGVNFKVFEYELEEPRSDDIKYISKYKVMQAYRLVNKPCISLDCGFWIDELDGFPKAFVNFALDTIGVEGILKLMEGKENRNCRFTECLSYYDGNELHQFMGKHEGTLSKEILGNDTDKKWSDLWYIYKPYGYEKTLAQMTEDERKNRKKYKSVDAMREFSKWYKEQDKIQQFKTLLNESKNIVFFGGAGVSTESGIPDFRSKDGLYNQKYKYPPEEILSHTFFMKHTNEFYKFYKDKINSLKYEPNITHIKLAELENKGKLKAIITQNIDGLHQKAGSKNVYELHRKCTTKLLYELSQIL